MTRQPRSENAMGRREVEFSCPEEGARGPEAMEDEQVGVRMRMLLRFSGLAAALIGCGSPVSDQVDRSEERWRVLRDANHASYQYTRSASTFIGYRSQTTVTLKKGALFSRSYVAYAWGDANPFEQWTEQGAAIGSHSAGAPSVPFDALYQQCRGFVARDPSRYKVHFTLDANGVVATCGAVLNGCQDDCFDGFVVDSLTLG